MLKNKFQIILMTCLLSSINSYSFWNQAIQGVQSLKDYYVCLISNSLKKRSSYKIKESSVITVNDHALKIYNFHFQIRDTGAFTSFDNCTGLDFSDVSSILDIDIDNSSLIVNNYMDSISSNNPDTVFNLESVEVLFKYQDVSISKEVVLQVNNFLTDADSYQNIKNVFHVQAKKIFISQADYDKASFVVKEYSYGDQIGCKGVFNIFTDKEITIAFDDALVINPEKNIFQIDEKTEIIII